MRQKLGRNWNRFPVATELRYRMTLAQPVERLRYQLELLTGGAGTDPTVRSITLVRRS
jgi:hypothetical protein